MASAAQTISVIIPAYNAAGTIGRAVRSALAEAEVAEVVVVDDVSSDDTLAQARAADDGSGRLKILSQAKNAGPAAARNRAIDESTAPWIAILDADDFFVPGRFARLLAHDADLIGDDAVKVDEHAVDGPRQSLLQGSIDVPRLVSFAEFVLSNVTDKKKPRGELGFLKPVMRREFLARHKLRYNEALRLGEDYELYARALGLGAKLFILPEAGYVSVVRGDSLSARHSEADLLALRNCDDDLRGIAGLAAADKAALGKHYASVDCRLQWRLLINAVKERDLAAAVGCFLRPWPVPGYLCGMLWEQVWERVI